MVIALICLVWFRHQLAVFKCPGTGHALERNIINITTTDGRHFFNTFIATVRRQQKNGVNTACLSAKRLHCSSFFRRQIDSKYAVNVGALCGIGKVLITHRLNRVEITHQHHRGCLVGLTEFGSKSPGFLSSSFYAPKPVRWHVG